MVALGALLFKTFYIDLELTQAVILYVRYFTKQSIIELGLLNGPHSY